MLVSGCTHSSPSDTRNAHYLRIAAADDIIAGLPAMPAGYSPPSEAQCAAIVSAIRTYRVTSPEMVVFGTLLRDALPPQAD